ncbi:MAG: anhydro-N-acetylmuramic acid kinase, partial [Pseudomonadota bacterium]
MDQRTDEGRPDAGPVWAVGVMTGTSMDGVDVAAIRTDGVEVFERLGGAETAMGDERRALIRFAVEHAADIKTSFLADRGRWPRWLRAVDAEVARTIGEGVASVRAALAGEGGPWAPLAAPEAEVVLGVHGQTVAHRPDEGFTLQIGAPPPGERLTAFDWTEVYDFRSADMAAGGEGAPLAPFYHFALARLIGAEGPVAFLNLGGVGNVTFVDPAAPAPEAPGALLAFDTGPGSALIDDWMRAKTGAAMDEDGAAAAVGRVHKNALRSNAAGAFLARRPPKSLDRLSFHGMLDAVRDLSVVDGAATLTAFTAECVAASRRWAAEPPGRWIVCGGGRRNPTLMRMLADRLGAPVVGAEAVGLDGDL